MSPEMLARFRSRVNAAIRSFKEDTQGMMTRHGEPLGQFPGAAQTVPPPAPGVNLLAEPRKCFDVRVRVGVESATFFDKPWISWQSEARFCFLNDAIPH